MLFQSERESGVGGKMWGDIKGYFKEISHKVVNLLFSCDTTLRPRYQNEDPAATDKTHIKTLKITRGNQQCAPYLNAVEQQKQR